MKISIGLRAKPDSVYYAILCETENEILIKSVDKIKIAKTLELPEQLKVMRALMLDIIREYNVTHCCIRIAESNARSISIERISIEGVLQELVASSSINKYKQVRIAQLASLLNMKAKDIKPIIDGQVNYDDKISKFSSFNKEEKEAVLSAKAGLNL